MGAHLERLEELFMPDPTDSQRGSSRYEAFVCFAGLLFVFTLAYVFVASAGVYWHGASAWPLVVYLAECGAIVSLMARANLRRAEQKAVLGLASLVIVLHFVAFGLSRVLWVAVPGGMDQALLVSRVLFYFFAASVGYWLACVVLFDKRSDVLLASVLPGCLLVAGAWWVLRDAIDAGQVVTSLGLGVALVASGVALFELSRISAVRRLFYSRPQNHLATELRNAKRVHESMFPEPITAEGFRFGYAYRPMRQIGGDFIHIHPDEPGKHSEGAFYLTLIDVTGHGITSALTVNRLHAELRQYFVTAKLPCPAEALGHLNEYVRLTMAEHGLFATGMCVKVDRAAGTLTIVNAGHPYCYYRSAGGLSEVEAEGPMLGVFPGEAFDAEPVTLPYGVGDQLVMVTDGAIESRSPADEPIGTERLRRIIDRSCRQTAPPDQATSGPGLLQRRMTGRLLDRADVRKPVGLIQQVLRQGLNAHPCALADEIMLSIDDFVQQDSQDDILIATIELLQPHRGKPGASRQAAGRDQQAATAETPQEVQI